MRLFGRSGFGFELTILGYQFPHLETEDYDSNWLNIKVDVVHPDGSWQASDPALLTYEAARLADWLEALARQEAVGPEESFMEPCLSFERLEVDGKSSLRTYFDLELRPRWKPVDGPGNEDLYVEAPLSELALVDAVGSLREQLTRFPQRAAR